ncbi:hypothetical protein [Dulcicalothrix desertica]|uniref:hypothetical protein n=1 Tax=Dulcicalothrix desertica TaxID=32056 RepID=UPI0011AAC008|nr:hypothetical protein [Dulcicalothrix desertica]
MSSGIIISSTLSRFLPVISTVVVSPGGNSGGEIVSITGSFAFWRRSRSVSTCCKNSWLRSNDKSSRSHSESN